MLVDLKERERLDEELSAARSIQLSLLPKEEMHYKDLKILGFCKPATEVGGDYYDIFVLLDNMFH